MQPTIPHYEDRPATPDELRKHVGLDNFELPISVGAVVEAKGAYGTNFFAVISGFDLRTGGWHYQGRRPTPNGFETVEISKKDILQSEAA